MKRDDWGLLATVAAFLAAGSTGCYQVAAPPVASGAAPVNRSPALSATTDEASPTVRATSIASTKVTEGKKSIVLSVPAMH